MEGKELLRMEPPEMLIADVRLGAFNGLQLALRRYVTHPDGASIITSAMADRMLEQEAAAIQAPFLVKPIEAVELLTLVDRGLEKDPAVRSAFRRWPRRRISGGFGAKVDDVAAVVIDVSDEGMCLEIPQRTDQAVPVCRLVSLPSFGLSLSVDPVWTKVDTEHHVLTCGAVLVPTDRDTMQAWRGVVDGVR